MGKSGKKMKRQQQKKQNSEQKKACLSIEEKFAEYFAAEHYEDVLETLAELIKNQDIKPEYLYKGAYSYFMLGDMERAAQWVQNTLTYAPGHIEARMLLAKICFSKNRDDDGLALYDYLWEHNSAGLTTDQKETIRDTAAYYARKDKNKVAGQFPQLAKLLDLQPEKPAATGGLPPLPGLEKVGENAAVAIGGLKARLMAIQAKQQKPISSVSDKSLAASDINEAAAGNEVVIQAKITEIKEQPCSLKDKIILLNRFAAGEYMQDNFSGAALYLQAALQLDDKDEASLRNMVMTVAADGDYDKAQTLAAHLPQVDFLLLQRIKDMQNE